jgi:hypothetical protein
MMMSGRWAPSSWALRAASQASTRAGRAALWVDGVGDGGDGQGAGHDAVVLVADELDPGRLALALLGSRCLDQFLPLALDRHVRDAQPCQRAALVGEGVDRVLGHGGPSHAGDEHRHGAAAVLGHVGERIVDARHDRLGRGHEALGLGGAGGGHRQRRQQHDGHEPAHRQG